MNLYQIMFEHFAPKDSEKGTLVYLLASSDEKVYEWLKSEPHLSNGDHIINSWKYKEIDGEVYDIYTDEWGMVETETFKERMIRLKGEINDEEAELSDLYYGKTLYGWKLVKENFEEDMFYLIKDNGILIERFD